MIEQQFIKESSKENCYNSELSAFYQPPQEISESLNYQNSENIPHHTINQIQEPANLNTFTQENKQQPKAQSPFQISHIQQPRLHNHVGEIVNQKNKEAIEELQDQMGQFMKLKDQNSICKQIVQCSIQNYFEESCKLFIRNSMISSKVNQTIMLFKNCTRQKKLSVKKMKLLQKQLILWYSQNFVTNFPKEKENESQNTGEDNQNSEKKKRYRRSAVEIKRHYKCPVANCDKSYGSEGSLSQHIKLKHPDYHCSTKSFSKKMDYEEKIENCAQEEQNGEGQNDCESKNYDQGEEQQKSENQVNNVNPFALIDEKHQENQESK